MKQITTKQFVCLIFLISMAVKMFMLPALLLRMVGKDGYLVMAGYIAFEFLNLTLLLLTARRNPDKTIYDILRDTFGRIASGIIIALFSLFLAVKALLIISELKIFFSVTMYAEIEWRVMILPLFALLYAFSSRQSRATGRAAELMTPPVLISTLVLCGLLLGEVHTENLLPFLENGISPVIGGALRFPVWFGDISVLMLFLGKIKISKGFVLASIAAKLVSSAVVIIFTCILFSTYADISTLIDYGNNVSNMTQFSLGSQDHGRFDLLFYCVWLFAVFIKLAIAVKFLTKNMTFLTGNRGETIVRLSCLLALYVVSEFILNNENIMFSFCTGIARVACPLAFVMPLALFISALFRYKPNRHRVGMLKKEGIHAPKKPKKQSPTA